MTETIYLYNLTIIIGLIALLSYLLIRLQKSQKPVRQHPLRFIGDSIRSCTEEEYPKRDKELKQLYDKEWKIYILVYFVPPILALMSFISIFNLDIGVILLILTGVSWLISEFAIKIWDIGVQKKGE